MRSPSSRISPAAMVPGDSSRPMIAVPVSDFPAPDSPTTPSTSPGAMEKLMPSTATSVPWRVRNSIRKSFTSRIKRGSAASSTQLRIQRVAQPVAEQIHREHQRHQRDAGKYRDPPFPREQELVADADQRAQGRTGGRHADAEERKRGLGNDRGGDMDG